MDGWSALVLAGGAGRRFASAGGGGKLLSDFGGVPLIRHVAERVVRADFAEVVVAAGAERALLPSALAGLSCRIVEARDWAEGMAATLRAGMAALAPGAQGVCIFLGDMPLVPVELCPELTDSAVRAGYAARPRVDGKPGHPVAFTRAAFSDLLALAGDRGATALLAAQGEQVAYVETADRGALFDIDTPADLAAVVRAWNA